MAAGYPDPGKCRSSFCTDPRKGRKEQPVTNFVGHSFRVTERVSLMLFRRLLPRGALLASAIILSSCASSTGSGWSSLLPGSPLSGAALAGSTAARPNLFADYVKVIFRNKSGYTLSVATLYSYPIIPFLPADHQCVKPGQDWTSEIGFEYTDGQVGVRAALTRNPDDCLGRDRFSAFIDFKQIQFYQERATITSQLEYNDKAGDYELCGRQTHPNSEKRVCALVKHEP